jgi:hypothetical protein
VCIYEADCINGDVNNAGFTLQTPKSSNPIGHKQSFGSEEFILGPRSGSRDERIKWR